MDYIMQLGNRVMLCLACFMTMYNIESNVEKVAISLVIIIVAAYGMYCDSTRQMCVIVLIYGICLLAYPKLIYGVPVVVYEFCDMVWKMFFNKNAEKDVNVSILTGICTAVIILYATIRMKAEVRTLIIGVLIIIAGVVLSCYCNIYIKLKYTLIVTKDNSRELNMALKAKNQYLIEKQDAQIYSATLKERNRIAREIHDNVGHMLSRSIIQTGAVIAVNKQENLKPLLVGIKDTLDGAMNSIRTSVHDLHDESIDLEQNIKDIIDGMKGYHTDFEYDCSSDMPRNVKYCMISIVKEACANIVKHSDANQINIVLREHPAFYQMLVSDNGKCVQKGDGTGIGIDNMRERVSAFNGHIEISSDKGYRIFVNIPKSKDE